MSAVVFRCGVHPSGSPCGVCVGVVGCGVEMWQSGLLRSPAKGVKEKVPFPSSNLGISARQGALPWGRAFACVSDCYPSR